MMTQRQTTKSLDAGSGVISASASKQASGAAATRSRTAAILLFSVATIGVSAGDLAFKTWAFGHVTGKPVVPLHPIPKHEAISVIPNLLSLRLTVNTGAVFGLGQGAQWLFVIVSIVATAVILRVFWRSHPKAYATHLCLALILAGALGNLYDRIRFSAVRDMLWLFPEVSLPFGLTWPGGATDLYPWLFNVADAILVIGVITLMVILWARGKHGPADQ